MPNREANMSKPFYTPVISVENISKKYFFSQKQTQPGQSKDNFFWALNNISFQLNQGDKLGVIGSNGSGKTTLLKILSQATAPTFGRIVQYGKLIPIIDIGSGFHPDLSGRENIFLYGTVMLGMKKAEIEANLADIIDFSELGNFIDEPIKNYSNGMYLRLALSIALFCKLDILLLDEIFSVGDRAFMLKSYDKMNAIIEQAATVVLASHSMDDIMRFCNKCIWLEKGEIKMMGNPNEVIAAYLHSNRHLLETISAMQSLALNKRTEWTIAEAPQNEYFRLVSATMQSGDAAARDAEMNYNYSAVIEITYEKTIADCEIGLTIMIADHYNTPLILTTHCFEEIENKSFYGVSGTIRYTCIIPKQLLNIGIYRVNLATFINNLSPSLYVSNVLTFKVVSDNEKQTSFLEKNPIKLTPAFSWSLMKLD